MKKGTSLAVGMGIVSILGTGALLMNQQKTEAVVVADPAIEAGLKASNTANLAIMNQASSAYSSAHGKPADNATDLLGGGMLDRIPEEGFSKLNSCVGTYDGTGGWVYAQGQFSPNAPQVLQAPQAQPTKAP